MEIKGKVHEVTPVMNVTETFKKRDLIVEYAENPQYPEYIKLEAMQDKVNLFDGLKPGDNVEVFFNLRGRPWTDRTGKTAYFNTLSVWRLNKLEQGSAPEYVPPVDVNSTPDDLDLPF